MSVLSEKLSYFTEQKDQNIADLAKRSGIERSTLYQYLKGKRPLQNRAQLEALMSELHLTPDERIEVMEAYELARVGVKIYNRRRKVREILGSLLTVESGSFEETGTEPDSYFCIENQNHFIKGELEVNRLTNQIIREAMIRGEEIKLLIQPDYSLLMESLMLTGNVHKDTKVVQIICLEGDSGQDGCANLESFRWVLRYGIGIQNYEPRYYYGKTAEHYGVMNIMPYLILTEQYAIQISSDQKAAVLHNNFEIILYFSKIFEKMYQHSCPMMSRVDGFGGGQAKWGLDYIRQSDFSNIMEMSSGLCSIQFWDERLIRKYINKNIPDCEAMIESYVAYTSLLYQKKRQGQTTVLVNASYVEEFIRTGVFREYPAVFFAEPVSVADRRILIEKILIALEEGWYHIRIMPEDIFSLSYHWEILVQRGKNLILQYAFENHFRIFQFEETDILEAIYDFLETTSAGTNVLDDRQSAALLRKWSDEILGS